MRLPLHLNCPETPGFLLPKAPATLTEFPIEPFTQAKLQESLKRNNFHFSPKELQDTNPGDHQRSRLLVLLGAPLVVAPPGWSQRSPAVPAADSASRQAAPTDPHGNMFPEVVSRSDPNKQGASRKMFKSSQLETWLREIS